LTQFYSLLLIYFGLIVLGAFFSAAERRWPARAGIGRSERRTDVEYWFFTPVVTGTLTRSATLGIVGLLAWSLGYSPQGGEFLATTRAASYWATGNLPLWLQAILVLLLSDLIGYWSHRLRHSRELWPFHAIHHGSVQLDWLAAARMHPVDDIVDNTGVGLPILLLGFDPKLFLLLGPLLFLHTMLVHANVSWTFGPLRFVFVSPALHRWHHAREWEYRPRNFAGVFAFIDVIFRTFYLPPSQPHGFGTQDETLPSGLGGQLTYPFKYE
jgi:sterol desaturase/sphingolipid hydroxylase (fatty acid hydroxylase superfamily)